MDRNSALNLIKEHVKTESLIKHMIAVGAIMRAFAEFFNEDKDKWEIVGLLHDIDYEVTKNDPKIHGLRSAEILKEYLDEDCLLAIKRHNFENNGSGEPQTRMEISLIVADALSGLIVATALVMPNKKLEEVKVKSVLSKFKDKSFARRVRRERILYCEKLGITLEKAVEIALKGLKEVAHELGL